MKRNEILIGLGLSLFVGVVLSPFASSWPDGLEWIAEQYGFIEQAQEEPLTPQVIPDYEMPGFSGGWATAAAGFLGTAIMYFAGWGMAKMLAKRKTASPSE
ncbi:MAG: PDGLE domain-containing protein [bacterium]|jgi:cobalt/nickel transport protein|nr:PDGLE domain-containing protein [bacterium]